MARLTRPIAGPILIGLASILCAFFALSGRALAQGTAPTLDHFRCYFTQGAPLSEVVGLTDQFDPATAGGQTFRVMYPVRLCNPVEKTHLDKVTPITNPDGHLKMYLIAPAPTAAGAVAQPAPARMVIVRNQFGFQSLRLGQPEILAVPTQKFPHNPPQGLDHFKCYRATGRSINQGVSLSDQFLQSPDVKVFEPFGFCNPVAKLHNDQVTPIQNPKAHLVCYTITREPFETSVDTSNQFGIESLLVHGTDLLCVPSAKLRVRTLQ